MARTTLMCQLRSRILFDPLASFTAYWILDEVDQTLTVHRHAAEGYVVVPRATADETVRPEPFDALELRVGTLLGQDDDDGE